ncbi:MAG: hypothetical protein J4432_05290 [DPANN group archaeon]|nr:hypothetical protein [DPANN group archaeon]
MTVKGTSNDVIKRTLLTGIALGLTVVVIITVLTTRSPITGQVIYQAETLDDYINLIVNADYRPTTLNPGTLVDTVPGFQAKAWVLNGVQFIAGMDSTNSNRTFMIVKESGAVVTSQDEATQKLQQFTTLNETLFNELSNQYSYIEQLTNSTFVISTLVTDDVGTYVAVFDEIGQEELLEDSNDLVRSFEFALPKLIVTSCNINTDEVTEQTTSLDINIASRTTSPINVNKILTTINLAQAPFSAPVQVIGPSEITTLNIAGSCENLIGEVQVSLPQTSNSFLSVSMLEGTTECGCEVL